MFTKLANGHALCVEAHGDIQQKAIVPPVNELWGQVEEYTSAHGWHEMTEQEIADFLKPEPTAEDRIAEIDARFKAIDLESLRPLRAIASGTETQADRDKLAGLDAEAEQLRAERATLTTGE